MKQFLGYISFIIGMTFLAVVIKERVTDWLFVIVATVSFGLLGYGIESMIDGKIKKAKEEILEEINDR